MSVFPPQTLNELKFPILRTHVDQVCKSEKKEKATGTGILTFMTNSKNKIQSINKISLKFPCLLRKVELHVIVNINMNM